MFYNKALNESNSHSSPKSCFENGTSTLNFSLDRPIKKCVNFALKEAHPLESSEKNHSSLKHNMNMNIMRDVQGIHAPLRIAMELRAFQQVGRLPFLSSSNLSSDIIMGRDDCCDFTDILYPADVHEQLSRPYTIMERF